MKNTSTPAPTKRSRKASASVSPAAKRQRAAKSTANVVVIDGGLADEPKRPARKRAAKAAAPAPVVETPKPKRTSAAQRVAAANGIDSAPLFVDHVHPETYTMSDDLDIRSRQLHKRWDDCELSMCTWAGQTDAARDEDAQRAVSLRAEMRAAAKAERSTITPEQGAELAELCAAAQLAASTFETLVCALIDGGASPTHVGQACGLGNSAVRRIVMRRDAERPAKLKS